MSSVVSLSLQVAIVGAGPSGFYAATELLKRDPGVQVTLYDRLPTPGGLARAGVSPDHAARRDVIPTYERIAVASGRFRFCGNVEIGTHLQHDELLQHHHAVIYASGASGDRRLGIPGEDLPGSHAATDFVGWYNGHPDFANRPFNLDCERAVVVGNGNVALDLARMLLMGTERLRRTDIADHALDTLAASRVREVVILGRRGAAQAAFTTPELLELLHLDDIDLVIENDALEAGHAQTGLAGDYARQLKLDLFREFTQRASANSGKRLVLRFLTSPLEILGHTRVEGLRIGDNRLVADANGQVRAEAIGTSSTLETGLVLRSVGYRGRATPGLPFDDNRGVLPNQHGRVTDPQTQQPLPGVYVTGWIKRGPSGVIGTNKVCAQQTVGSLLQDASSLRTRALTPAAALESLLAARQPQAVDYLGWKAIDRSERARGTAEARPRIKYAQIAQLLHAARI